MLKNCAFEKSFGRVIGDRWWPRVWWQLCDHSSAVPAECAAKGSPSAWPPRSSCIARAAMCRNACPDNHGESYVQIFSITNSPYNVLTLSFLTASLSHYRTCQFKPYRAISSSCSWTSFCLSSFCWCGSSMLYCSN